MTGKPIQQGLRGVSRNCTAQFAGLLLAASSLTATMAALAQNANIDILCDKVKDLPLPNRLFATASTTKEIGESDCASDPKNPGGTLIGAGEVQVEVNSAALDKFLAEHKKMSGTTVLFLTGVSLANDAKFISGDKRPAVPAQQASERTPTVPEEPEISVLRFRIVQGDGTQVLWSMPYADGASMPLPLSQHPQD